MAKAKKATKKSKKASKKSKFNMERGGKDFGCTEYTMAGKKRITCAETGARKAAKRPAKKAKKAAKKPAKRTKKAAKKS